MSGDAAERKHIRIGAVAAEQISLIRTNIVFELGVDVGVGGR